MSSQLSAVATAHGNAAYLLSEANAALFASRANMATNALKLRTRTVGRPADQADVARAVGTQVNASKGERAAYAALHAYGALHRRLAHLAPDVRVAPFVPVACKDAADK